MMKSRNGQRRMPRALITALLASLVALVLTGCAGGIVDNANRTSFGGISFAMPSGWTSTVSNDSLAVKIPEKSGVVSIITGTHRAVDNSLINGLEGYALDAFLGGMVGGLEESNGRVVDESTTTIDGKTAKTVKCTATISGHSVDVYLFAVLVDDGVTSLVLGSSDGTCNEQFEAILKSVRIVHG